MNIIGIRMMRVVMKAINNELALVKKSPFLKIHPNSRFTVIAFGKRGLVRDDHINVLFASLFNQLGSQLKARADF